MTRSKLSASVAIHGILLSIGLVPQEPKSLKDLRRTAHSIVLRAPNLRRKSISSPAREIQRERTARTFTPPHMSLPAPAIPRRTELILPEIGEVPAPTLGPSLTTTISAPAPKTTGAFDAIAEEPRRPSPPISLTKGGFNDTSTVPASSGTLKTIHVGAVGAVTPSTTPIRPAQTLQSAVLATAVFSKPQSTAASVTHQPPTGIVIDFKPTPNYTDEARRLRIEGQVIISVRFKPSGKAEAIQVIEGLGHGLDEAALAAVPEIRFHRNDRDQSPVEQIASMRFIFRLAY